MVQKINGFRKRWRNYKYGITYLKSTDFRIPDLIKVNGARKRLFFDNKLSTPFIYEFSQICIDDCYQLGMIKKKINNVKSIVDIGGNQGLFLLSARQTFPNAGIFCYEPNYNLKKYLDKNTEALNAECFYEAVTRRDCMVTLNFTGNDLETVTKESADGNVKGTAFSEVIKRSGGQIDVLKMDCEGAEWDLLEEKELFKKVRSITMEYHLWAKPGMTVELLVKDIEGMGFEVIYTSEISHTFGLLVAVRP
jgi:FkbM family methyltransferase